jgi:hypothetical protein
MHILSAFYRDVYRESTQTESEAAPKRLQTHGEATVPEKDPTTHEAKALIRHNSVE